MSLRRTILSAVGILCSCITARAGPVTTFTDLDAFLEAAGDVREIDFETLPDGTPSFSGAEITPDFNYTDQGVEFFSHIPELRIFGGDPAGFNLCACGPKALGARNWLIAEFIVPATAVGIIFSGSTVVTLFDQEDNFLRNDVLLWTGFNFFGVVSDVAIARVIVDDGDSARSVNSFFSTPVPDPGTLVLLAFGSLGLARRRRRAARCPQQDARTSGERSASEETEHGWAQHSSKEDS